jgi:hypothetical protein
MRRAVKHHEILYLLGEGRTVHVYYAVEAQLRRKAIAFS